MTTMAKIELILIFLVSCLIFSCGCSEEKNQKRFTFILDFIFAQKNNLNTKAIANLIKLYFKMERIKNVFKERLKKIQAQQFNQVKLQDFFRF